MAMIDCDLAETHCLSPMFRGLPLLSEGFGKKMYVICGRFVYDLPKVGGLARALQFPPLRKLRSRHKSEKLLLWR